MNAWQKIVVTLGSVATIGSGIGYIAPAVSTAYTEMHQIVALKDSVSYLRGKLSEQESFALIIYKDQANIERIVNYLEKQDSLLAKGKEPFDSLVLISRSGHPYKTTLKEAMR